MVSNLLNRILENLRRFSSDLNVANLKVFQIKKIIDLVWIILEVLGVFALFEGQHSAHHWLLCFKLFLDLFGAEDFGQLNSQAALWLTEGIVAVLLDLFEKDPILANNFSH